ncbi:MAG: NUDIX hydrolase [Rhizobiaceae bacterium]
MTVFLETIENHLGKFLAPIADWFFQPEKTQIAALCYRTTKKGAKVLLITSRGTGRWILPKGWPLKNASSWKTAEQEAYEEAGIVGKPGRDPVGSFRSYKDLDSGERLRTEVVVYPVKVSDQKKSYPEAGQRELKWLRIEDAAEQCDDSGLAKFLRQSTVKNLLDQKK